MKLCSICQMLYAVKKILSKLKIKQILILYKITNCFVTKIKKTSSYKKITTLNPMCIGISHQTIVFQTKKLNFTRAQLHSINFKYLI